MDNIQKLKQIMQDNHVQSPFYLEVVDLMERLDPNGATWEIITEMFNLHNKMFPQIKEHSTFCDKCRSRVYRRLQNWMAAESHKPVHYVDEQEVLVANATATEHTEHVDGPVQDVVQEPAVAQKPKRGRKKAAPKNQ